MRARSLRSVASSPPGNAASLSSTIGALKAYPLLSRLALSAATVLAFLLAVEMGLRLWGFAPERYRNTARVFAPGWRVALDCFPTNPRDYFDVDLRDEKTRARYREAGVSRVDEVAPRAPFAVELRFNSLRFREAEIGPRRPGVVRVMVLGDSFTEGEGVKEADVYPHVLGALLNAAEPGRWEVLDCGRRGADFPELYRSFEQILAYEPDIVVYGMVLNDPVQSPGFHARQAYLNDWIVDRSRMLEGPLQPRLGPFDARLAAYLRERVQGFRVGHDATRWYIDMFGEPNREGWQETQAYLGRMNRSMRERGGWFLVALWPLMVGLDGRYPFEGVHQEIARFCLRSGIPERDLLPAMRGRAPASLWVHPVDLHPNEIAHHLAAEELAPAVRALAPARRN
jgi:GDSL-like lipase/acylhydrolase family protein